MANCFWLGPPGKNESDVIAPGNWGRIVMSTPGHDWMPMEVIFEQVRQAIDPNLPSRLSCAFVFDNLSTARLLNTKRPNDIIYRVTLVDENAQVFRTEMALIHPEVHDPLTYERARSYWRQSISNPRWPEVLTMSPLKIVSKL